MHFREPPLLGKYPVAPARMGLSSAPAYTDHSFDAVRYALCREAEQPTFLGSINSYNARRRVMGEPRGLPMTLLSFPMTEIRRLAQDVVHAQAQYDSARHVATGVTFFSEHRDNFFEAMTVELNPYSTLYSAQSGNLAPHSTAATSMPSI